MECVDSVSATLHSKVRIGVLHAILHGFTSNVMVRVVSATSHMDCVDSLSATLLGSDLQRTSVWPVSSFQMPSEGKVAQTEFGKR